MSDEQGFKTDSVKTAGFASLDICASPECVAAVLDFSETLLRGLGFAVEEQRHVRLALEEMFEFLKRSALNGQEDSPVQVIFEPQADGVLVRMLVKGMPMDVGKMPGYLPSNATNRQDAEALSLFLAKSVVDRLAFANRGRQGLELEMFKHRSGAHIKNQSVESAGEQRDNQPADYGRYIIRPMRPEEAIEVSRCAYLTYGHTYEDFIYYPERIVELNRSGEMRSLVAISEDGDVMGHCALKFTPGRYDRAEFGVLFVKPRYRKHGLGAALWSAAVEKARDLGLQSVFARSVTGHRASQAIAVKNGFKDCALFLALFPQAVDLKAISGVQSGKMSGMLQTLPIVSQRQRRVNPPDCYAGIITELYRRAGIPAEHGAALQSAGQPVFKAARAPVLNIAVIEVEKIGVGLEDAQARVSWALRRFCREKIDVVYLYVNLEEEASSAMAEYCVKEGFIFSGIAPDAFPEADALVLQYINVTGNPFEQMTVWTDTAELMRDFILREWQNIEKDSGD